MNKFESTTKTIPNIAILALVSLVLNCSNIQAQGAINAKEAIVLEVQSGYNGEELELIRQELLENFFEINESGNWLMKEVAHRGFEIRESDAIDGSMAYYLDEQDRLVAMNITDQKAYDHIAQNITISGIEQGLNVETNYSIVYYLLQSSYRRVVVILDVDDTGLMNFTLKVLK